MRTIVGAALSLAIFGTAQAADFYTVPSPLNAYSWAGPYLGSAGGYEWAKAPHNQTRTAGFGGGIEAGYDWHVGGFVLGGETAIYLSDAEVMLAPWQFADPWFGNVRGRVGVAPRWSAKAEWLYLDVTNRDFAPTGTGNTLAANLLPFGLNYRF